MWRKIDATFHEVTQLNHLVSAIAERVGVVDVAADPELDALKSKCSTKSIRAKSIRNKLIDKRGLRELALRKIRTRGSLRLLRWARCTSGSRGYSP